MIRFAQVIKALWRGQYKSFSPTDFKDIIGEYRLGFKNCDQQDAHEFLTFFLEWIHGDLKRDIVAKEEGSLSSAKEEWLKLLKGQSSIISDLFTGQLKSTICCSVCSYKSETYEIFTSLSLSLPEVNHCTLNECLKDFFGKRPIDGWNCPQCKTAREAIINYDLVKLAQNFIIHLKRFSNDDTRLGKKNTSVIFPLQELNLKPYFVIVPESQTAKHQDYNYHLYALSNHYGTMDGGHYTAFCKNAPLNEWYKYDDSSVYNIIEQDVESQKAHAYLLFYTSQVKIADQNLNKKPRKKEVRLPPTLQTRIAVESVQIEENEDSRDGEERSNLLDNVINSESDPSESEIFDLIVQVYPRKAVPLKPSKPKSTNNEKVQLPGKMLKTRSKVATKQLPARKKESGKTEANLDVQSLTRRVEKLLDEPSTSINVPSTRVDSRMEIANESVKCHTVTRRSPRLMAKEAVDYDEDTRKRK